jgi:hypothetical protein
LSELLEASARLLALLEWSFDAVENLGELFGGVLEGGDAARRAQGREERWKRVLYRSGNGGAELSTRCLARGAEQRGKLGRDANAKRFEAPAAGPSNGSRGGRKGRRGSDERSSAGGGGRIGSRVGERTAGWHRGNPAIWKAGILDFL